MPSERVQRRIDRLLDQAEEALEALDWARVGEIAGAVLVVDPENEDARSFLAMAQHNLGAGEAQTVVTDVGADSDPPEGGPLPTPTRQDVSGEGAPTNVPPLPSAGESLPRTRSGGRGAEPGPSRASGHEGIPNSFANNRYEVRDFLGEGGKKRVYRAHDTLLDREVAFALIKTEDLDEASRSRITREAQAMGRLGTHPNIVTVFDLGVEGDSLYIVTELMGGGDVEGLLASTTVGAGSGPPTPSPQPSPAEGRGGTNSANVGAYGNTPSRSGSNPPLPAGEGWGEGEDSPRDPGPSSTSGRGGLSLEKTIEIGKSICDGLQFAHSRDIVHRDLKPGNVWLTEDPSSGSGQAQIAKIGDFGLAMMTDRTRLTREAVMVGTVSYMPPEQATGGDITPRADLYSLGAMLYEMVTGRPPFLGDDDIAIIGQHINTAPVAPTWHNGACPRPLEALIMRLLSKDPAERPESALDVSNALNAIDLTARGESVEQDATSLESLAGGVFVGRQTEMDQLKAALEDVLGGSGRLVTLVGEPGIGKTRTSEELATYAGLRGAQVLWGRCYETGGQPPYWPWVQAIRSYVREIDSDELRRQMGSSASVVAEVVTDVKDRLPELQPPPAMDDPESARFRLFDSIASFLRTASQAQPLVLVLDDLHWSDQPSLAFLEFMARELGQSRVMLICTYRDMELNRRHPLTVTLGDLARERLYERVLLRGLSEQDVGRFIEIAAGFNPPAGLSETVHRHTEGNPLFITEVVRELVQSGELNKARSGTDTSWSIRIPEGTREVIGRRLDRLSERANDVLTIASIVGRQFTLDSLRAIVEDTTEGQLLDVLDEALAARVVEEMPSSVRDYQFTHALFQETFTGELSSARKVRLHSRIGEALEELYGDRADEYANDMVVHFAEAEPILGADKLIRYSTIAGARALDSAAYEAALGHLTTASVAFGDGPMTKESADVVARLGLARIAVNDGITGSSDLTRAFNFYVENGFEREAIDIASRPYNVQLLSRLMPVVRKGIELTAEGSLEYGRSLVPLGWVQFLEGNADAARESLSEAITLARQYETPVLEMQALAMRANLEGFDARPAESLEAAAEALELVRDHPDPETEMRARLWLTSGLVAVGRSEDAKEEAEKFMEAALNFGHGVWVSRASGQLLRESYQKGDWAGVLETADRIERFIPVDAVAARLTVNLWKGEIDEARVGWQELVGSASPRNTVSADHITDLSTAVIVWGLEALGELGRTGETLEDMRRTLWNTATIQINARAGFMIGFLRLPMIIEAGDRDELQEWYDVNADRFGAMTVSAIGVTGRGLSRARRILGDLDGAIDHIDEAINTSRDRGYRLDLARSLDNSAELLRERNQDGDIASAEEREDEALNIAQDLGMRPLTERILKRREILRA